MPTLKCRLIVLLFVKNAKQLTTLSVFGINDIAKR